MFRNSIVPITAGVMLALAGSAQAAGTKTATFAVNATVASNCFITTTPLAFGSYDGTAAIDSNATIVVRCTKNAALPDRPGRRHDGRLPRSASDCLPARAARRCSTTCTRPSAQNTIWGNNAGGTGWVTGVGGGLGVANQVTHTVFGNLPNNATNQGAGVGAYSDLITATITY